MDQSENPIAKTEPEANVCDVEVKSSTSEGVQAEAPINSVVKPVVEEINVAAKSLIDNVTSSSYVTQMEKQVEKLVSDPWASLKNLGAAHQESSCSATEDAVLPTSDKNVGVTATSVSDKTVDDSEKTETGDLDENPKTMATQPFVAVTAAGQNAWWMNCCGLLDVLKRSEE